MGLVGDGDYAPEGEFASGSGDWNSEQRKGQRGGLGPGLYRRDGARKKERERGTVICYLPCMGVGGLPFERAPSAGERKER